MPLSLCLTWVKFKKKQSSQNTGLAVRGIVAACNLNMPRMPVISGRRHMLTSSKALQTAMAPLESATNAQGSQRRQREKTPDVQLDYQGG
jgi:hypothetical protein